jgi:hypothetical protein
LTGPVFQEMTKNLVLSAFHAWFQPPSNPLNAVPGASPNDPDWVTRRTLFWVSGSTVVVPAAPSAGGVVEGQAPHAHEVDPPEGPQYGDV